MIKECARHDCNKTFNHVRGRRIYCDEHVTKQFQGSHRICRFEGCTVSLKGHSQGRRYCDNHRIQTKYSYNGKPIYRAASFKQLGRISLHPVNGNIVVNDEMIISWIRVLKLSEGKLWLVKERISKGEILADVLLDLTAAGA